MKNPCGKQRPVENPYAIFHSEDGWEWRVLKKNQAPDVEAKNPYASWLCAVKSPHTFGGYDYGDVYISTIREHGVDVTQEIKVAEKLTGEKEKVGR
jgi:hypothetical protein